MRVGFDLNADFRTPPTAHFDGGVNQFKSGLGFVPRHFMGVSPAGDDGHNQGIGQLNALNLAISTMKTTLQLCHRLQVAGASRAGSHARSGEARTHLRSCSRWCHLRWPVLRSADTGMTPPPSRGK